MTITFFDVAYEFITCCVASILFANLMRAPKKLLFGIGLCSGASFVVFWLLEKVDHPFLGYFLAAFIISIWGEIGARIYKTPTSMFIASSLKALVPGIMLCRCIINLLRGDYDTAIQQGVFTLLASGAIAMALALSWFLVYQLGKNTRRQE